MDQKEILKKIEENKGRLRGFGVKGLSLFGSFAKGVEAGTSDIDFLVEFEKKSFDNYMELKFFLEDLFGRPVDLVIPETLKKRLKDSILRENIRVHGL